MSEYELLLENARVAAALNRPELANLTSRLALLDYIRMADEIAAAAPRARLLDWGCGYGLMSFLLTRRGLDVVSYDVGEATVVGRLPISRDLDRLVGADPVRLPFADREFDAVLSCGVLEHVPNEDGSLDEITRVLRPGGRFFIYNLPNRYSYKEYLIERLRLGYSHERKYTFGSIRWMLERHGMSVEQIRRGGWLPHMMTGMPAPARALFQNGAPLLFPIDRVLSRVAVLNGFAEAIEVRAIVTGRGA